MSGMFFNFKKYFFDRNIRQNRPANIARKGRNLKQAQTFGIVFDASTADNEAIAASLQSFLEKQQKQVHILGYKPHKKKEEVLPAHVFSKESIGWNFIPDSSLVDGFVREEFDVLICLQQENLLPLEYIMAMSRASFRIGKHFEAQEENYELMIHMDASENMQNLKDHVIGWLEKLKF